MQDNPLVSVIVPVYNVEKYLKKCIESIINQTYKNIEIILVDDGSTDNSDKICDEFSLKDSRIKVIHKKNGGLSDARNAGLDIMSGEWVVFVDSDDFGSKYYVENLFFLTQKYNVDIAITSFKKFYDLKQKFVPKKITNEKVLIHSAKDAIKNMFYIKHYTVSACGTIYKKNLFDEIRFPKGELYEDLSTIPLVIAKVNKIAFCDLKDYFYLQRDNSITGKIKEKNFYIFDILSKLESKFSDAGIKDAILWHKVQCSFAFLKSSLELKNSAKITNELKSNITSNIKTILFDGNYPLKSKIASLILYIFGVKIYTYFYSFFKFMKRL